MAVDTLNPRSWLYPTPRGLYCKPGDFYVDPAVAVPRAVITHGHGDHARPGHHSALATPETLAIMRARFEDMPDTDQQPLKYGESVRVGEVDVRFAPAGHILGSAQAVLAYKGQRIVVSGDFKRRPDATCPPFEPVPCDVFITEATFGLPVFRHGDPAAEIARLVGSTTLFPERAHLVGAYALGKAQRLLALLRQAGYDRPIYLHGAWGTFEALLDDAIAASVPVIDAAGAVLDASDRDVAAARAALARVLPPGTIDPDGLDVDVDAPFRVALQPAA